MQIGHFQQLRSSGGFAYRRNSVIFFPVGGFNVVRLCLQTDGSQRASPVLLLIPVREVWPRAKGDGVLHQIRHSAPHPPFPPPVAESYLCSSFHPPRPQSRRHRNRRCRFLSWRTRSGTGARGRLTAALQGGAAETRWELVDGGKRIREVEMEMAFLGGVWPAVSRQRCNLKFHKLT